MRYAYIGTNYCSVLMTKHINNHGATVAHCRNQLRWFPFSKSRYPLNIGLAKIDVSCEIDLVQIRVNLDLANLCGNGFCAI